MAHSDRKRTDCVREQNALIRNENHILKCMVKNLLDNPDKNCSKVFKSVVSFCKEKCQQKDSSRMPCCKPGFCPPPKCCGCPPLCFPSSTCPGPCCPPLCCKPRCKPKSCKPMSCKPSRRLSRSPLRFSPDCCPKSPKRFTGCRVQPCTSPMSRRRSRSSSAGRNCCIPSRCSPSCTPSPCCAIPFCCLSPDCGNSSKLGCSMPSRCSYSSGKSATCGSPMSCIGACPPVSCCSPRSRLSSTNSYLVSCRPFACPYLPDYKKPSYGPSCYNKYLKGAATGYPRCPC